MKSLIRILSVVAMAFIFAGVDASAAFTTPGNLILGFRVTEDTNSASSQGFTKNVVIDLGSPTDISISTQNSYNLSSASSVLSSTYGANWWTRDDLYYGVISYSSTEIPEPFDLIQSFYSTRLNNSAAVRPSVSDTYQLIPPQVDTLGLNTPETAISAGTVSGLTRDGQSLSAQYLVLDKDDSASWSTLSLDGWGSLFAESQDNLVTSFNASTNALGIYRNYGGIYTGLDQSIPAAIYISGGSLVVVPEPSTYMLLLVSAAIFFFAIRRRKLA